jgi:hypothetical protein
MLMPCNKIESLDQVPACDGYVVDADLVFSAPEGAPDVRMRLEELGRVAYLVMDHSREAVGDQLGHKARFHADPVTQERTAHSAALLISERPEDVAYLSPHPLDEEIARHNHMQFVLLSAKALLGPSL